LGVYTTAAVLNCFLLQIPLPENSSLPWYDPAIARSVVKALVEAWAPDQIRWAPSSWALEQGGQLREPVVGWWTYIRGYAPEDVPGVEAEPLDHGVLIRAAPTFDQTDLALVTAMRRHLVDVGVIHQILPEFEWRMPGVVPRPDDQG